MIVRSTNTGWEVIHQQAHGLLALQLALHWHEKTRPPFWPETLVALTEHDDGQDEWADHNHLTEAGAPLDFTILQYSVEQCRKMIQIGLEKSRWNALMLSMHTTFLYEEKRGQDPALDEFLDQQQRNQRDWQKQYGVSKTQVQYAYDFLQFCDALSLVLVRGQVPPEGRQLEISKGPDGKPYFIHQRPETGTLNVAPWPFGVTQFEVCAEVYHLNQLQFANDKELYDALGNAPFERRSWTFKK